MFINLAFSVPSERMLSSTWLIIPFNKSVLSPETLKRSIFLKNRSNSNIFVDGDVDNDNDEYDICCGKNNNINNKGLNVADINELVLSDEELY